MFFEDALHHHFDSGARAFEDSTVPLERRVKVLAFMHTAMVGAYLCFVTAATAFLFENCFTSIYLLRTNKLVSYVAGHNWFYFLKNFSREVNPWRVWWYAPLHDINVDVSTLSHPYIAHTTQHISTGHGRDSKCLFTFRATDKPTTDFSSHTLPHSSMQNPNEAVEKVALYQHLAAN